MTGASRTAVFPTLVVVILIGAIAACGDGQSDAVPSPTPRDAQAIRDLDLKSAPVVTAAVRQLGGEVDLAAVVYWDLTGDGREEAVVPISSGGTLGNVAYLVLTVRSGVLESILTKPADGPTGGGIVMSVEDGRLVSLVPVYGPEDPLCCPASLKKTTYRWDGSRLQSAGEEVIPNPNAPKKQ